MKLKTLSVNKMIRKYNMKEVYNYNIDGAGGLFDPEIFGTGEKKKTQMGYIKLQGFFVDPATYIYVSRRGFRKLPFIINKDKKFIINKSGVIEEHPNGETGLKWLYENFDKIKFKEDDSNIMNKYTRDEFFTDKFPVMPQHYRDINTTEGSLKVDELNQYYIDLIRATQFKKTQGDNPGMDNSFIDMKIQGILVSIVEYISKMTFFKTGAQRQSVMGRSVDNSARVVMAAPEIKMKDTLGKGRIDLDNSKFPLHHLVNMCPIQILSKTQSVLKYFYDLKLMDNLDFEEYENYFNDDFIKEKMKEYYYAFAERSKYVEGPNGERFIFDFKFTDEKGRVEEVTRGITWMELFYIAYDQIKDKVRVQSTRYPVTDKGSAMFSKASAIVLNTDISDCEIKLNGTIIYKFDDFCNITPYIEDPVSNIYEETQKVSNLVLESFGMDYDGDKMISRPLYSEEAVNEIDKYNRKPLSILNLSGQNIRNLGKEPVQCIYDLTNNRPKDMKPEDTKFNQFLVEFFTPNRDFKLSEIVDLINKWSIYTKVKFKGNITTLGRVIFNEVIFNHIENHEFINETVRGSTMRSILDKYAGSYLLPGKITIDDYKLILNRYHDLAFSLCDIIGSSMTMSMLVNDDPVFNKKKAELIKKYGIDKEDFNDPVLMNQFETEMIAFSKEHYKDDDMYALYDSGAGPKWGVDYKNMKISVGVAPSPDGTMSIIKGNLKEGLKQSDVMASANMQITGAIARGKDTADGGYQVKKYTAAMQSGVVIEGDCGSKVGLKTIDHNIADLIGRTVIDGSKNVLITYDNVNDYLGKEIIKRSPLFCTNKEGYCSTCAGKLPLQLSQSSKMPIGLFVSEIGSRVMNISMKATHDMTQKLFKFDDLDDFLDR